MVGNGRSNLITGSAKINSWTQIHDGQDPGRTGSLKFSQITFLISQFPDQEWLPIV
jgi:hypothetical protein